MIWIPAGMVGKATYLMLDWHDSSRTEALVLLPASSQARGCSDCANRAIRAGPIQAGVIAAFWHEAVFGRFCACVGRVNAGRAEHDSPPTGPG